MAFIKQLNNKSKTESETDLSRIGNLSGRRFFNKDGTPNIQVKGYIIC